MPVDYFKLFIQQSTQNETQTDMMQGMKYVVKTSFTKKLACKLTQLAA